MPSPAFINLLVILGVTSFGDALAILQSDGWFTGKTTTDTPRYVDLRTGKTSKKPGYGYVRVDIDTMNKITDKSKLTPEYLERNLGLLSAFAFSIASNINVLRQFRKIVAYLRANGADIKTFTAIQKVFISHLAWALANIGTTPSWTNITYDPLVAEMLKASATPLELPTIELADTDSSYFSAFEYVATNTTDDTIRRGIELDAERYEFFIARC